jgi:hypothetical protein
MSLDGEAFRTGKVSALAAAESSLKNAARVSESFGNSANVLGFLSD